MLLGRAAAELTGTSLGQPIVVDGSTELGILRKNGALTPNAREHLSKVSNIRIEKPFDVAGFKTIGAELIVAHRARSS